MKVLSQRDAIVGGYSKTHDVWPGDWYLLHVLVRQCTWMKLRLNRTRSCNGVWRLLTSSACIIDAVQCRNYITGENLCPLAEKFVHLHIEFVVMLAQPYWICKNMNYMSFGYGVIINTSWVSVSLLVRVCACACMFEFLVESVLRKASTDTRQHKIHAKIGEVSGSHVV
jgi:hypothetical protein